MVILKEYQQRAVDELVKATVDLFNVDHDKKQLVFKGSTGSGKTVVASKYIEAMSNVEDEEVCFIWISIGTGSLHEQSKNRINEILEGNPTCKLLEEVIPDGEIGRNQVVVINWEKLNRKKKDEWDNILMRDGEKTNFHDVIGRTLEKRKIILIIDESHRSTDTKTSNELQEIIEPEIIIHMSATPKHTPLQGSRHERFVEIPVEDVIKEGVIKKEVLINDTVDDTLLENEENAMEILEMVLDMSFKRRESIKEGFSELGKDINPLCLIQIPNSDKGEEVLSDLYPLLEERGVTIDNGRLAIWTSKESSNLENINDYDSKVDFLIFKMAVATGWDCPRAYVLLKLREVKSEVFDIQTIGRILRMPERYHYENELLNKAYIYTNNDDIQVKMENLNMVKWIKSIIRDGLENIELISYYKRDESNMLINRPILNPIFFRILEENTGIGHKTTQENIQELENHGFDMNFTVYKDSIVSSMAIKAEELDNEVLKENVEEDTLSFKTSTRGINKAFMASLQAASPRLYETFKSLWIKRVGALIGISPKDKGGETKLETFYLNNKEKLENMFVQVFKEYDKEYKKKKVKDEKEFFPLFKIQEPGIRSEDGMEHVFSNKYIFTECWLKSGRKGPERNFERFLESHGDKISWWYKNEDSGSENFAIKYEYDGDSHGFYPDYLVKFIDGSIGIFETKSEKDRDGRTITKAKAEALRPYLEEESRRLGLKVWGGIVVSSDERNILINENTEYNPYSDKPDEWKSLAI